MKLQTTNYELIHDQSISNNHIIHQINSNDENDMSKTTRILIAIACVIVICLSLIGNTLVVSVIIRYKRLKNATNYILLSLAIADLTVSFLVMLPAMIQDVIQRWIFSDIFCKFYNAFDITCCTASILHLLLVAIDRYVAIFKPLTYRNVVRKWHVFTAVILVWALSLGMSFIPIFMGWNHSIEDTSNSHISNLTMTIHSNFSSNHSLDNVLLESPQSETCILEVNIPYAIISSSLSFYIPLVIMTIVYLQIYIVARRQANAIAQIDKRSRKFSQDQNNFANSNNNLNNNNNSLSRNSGDLLNDQQMMKIKKILSENGECRTSDDKSDKKSIFLKLLTQLKSFERKRTKDTKAIKTLGIIMGIFILCWLPFFIMYLIVPITNLMIPRMVERIITWIGYVNSFINPIIYALTNKDFRKAYLATLKTVSKKLCPKSIYQSTFGTDDQPYFVSKNTSKRKNTRLSFFHRAIKLCKCCSKRKNTSSSLSVNLNNKTSIESNRVKIFKNGDLYNTDSNLDELIVLKPTSNSKININNNTDKADQEEENVIACPEEVVVSPAVVEHLKCFSEDVNNFSFIDTDLGTSDLLLNDNNQKIMISNENNDRNDYDKIKVDINNNLMSNGELDPLNQNSDYKYKSSPIISARYSPRMNNILSRFSQRQNGLRNSTKKLRKFFSNQNNVNNIRINGDLDLNESSKFSNKEPSSNHNNNTSPVHNRYDKNGNIVSCRV